LEHGTLGDSNMQRSLNLFSLLLSLLTATVLLGATAVGADSDEKKADATKQDVAMSDLLGKWEFRIETSDGDIFTPTLEIAEKDGKAEGIYTWEDKKIPVKELKLQDNQLSFTVVTELDGQELKTDYKGKPSGDKISGKVDYKLGDDSGSLDFTAKRAVAASEPAGKWDLRIETPDGDIFTPTLEIAQKGDTLEGVYTWQDKKTPVKELKLQDNALTFTVVVDADGQELKTDYKGRLNGDKISGTINYKLGGDTGTVDFTGKRAAQ
jgi:hypothetical protein